MDADTPSPTGLPADLVWTFAGSEVTGWHREGDALHLGLAVAAVRGTLDASEGSVDGNLIPLWVRCERVGDWPPGLDHPHAVAQGTLQDGPRVWRHLAVPGRTDAVGEDGLLTLVLAWRQGGEWRVRCRSVVLGAPPDARLLASWAC